MAVSVWTQAQSRYLVLRKTCTETHVVLPHGCQNTEDKAEVIQTCTDHRTQDCLSGHLPREMGSDNHTELHVTSCSGFKWNSHMLRIVKVSFKGWGANCGTSTVGTTIQRQEDPINCYTQQVRDISKTIYWLGKRTLNVTLCNVHKIPFMEPSWNDRIIQTEHKLAVASEMGECTL